MARPKGTIKWPPKYTKHKASGQARVRLPDGREKYLGRYNSKESKDAYARLIAEGLATKGASIDPDPKRVTVAELCAAFLAHFKTRNSHAGTCQQALTSLRHLCVAYGTLPAAEFGPRKLKAFVDGLIVVPYRLRRCDLPEGVRTRTNVNMIMGLVKRVFRFAAANEMVDGSVYHAINAIRPLQPNESAAAELPRRVACDDRDIEAVLPFLTPPVRAAVQVQRLTGARCSEILTMRLRDIDRSAPTWLYRPLRHKTMKMGIDRIIPLGPRAQAVMTPFLDRGPDAFLFTPRESFLWNCANRPRPGGKSSPARLEAARRYEKKRSLGRAARRTFTPYFSSSHYCDAIKRGFEKARRAAAQSATGPEPKRNLQRWTSHQIRHRFATNEARRTGTLRTAQLALGHTDEKMTKRYVTGSIEELTDVFADHY